MGQVSGLRVLRPDGMSNILIIEDDPLLRGAMSSALRTSGHSVHEVADEPAAWDAIRSQVPDLVLCDVCLPRGNGMKLLSRFRKNPATALVPCILMTGQNDGVVQRQGMELGADDFLMKPFTAETLLAAAEARLAAANRMQVHAQESEARLAQIIEASTDLVLITDAGGRQIRYANRAALRGLGLDDSLPATGLTLAEFLPSDEAQRFWRVSVPKALQDGSRVDEGLFLARNGRLFPVSRQVLAHRGNNGVARQLSIIARDITQAKEVEKELRESKFFLNSLLQSIPAPVFYKDTQGRYLGVNRAFETFYGRSHDDIVGKTVFEVAPVEFARVYHQKDLELFEQPGPLVYECQARNAGGDVRDVVYHKAPIMNAAGVVTGLVGVILDITERVRAEDQVRTLSRAIEQSPASIVITDPTGLIEYVNPTFTRVTGYSMAEVLHQNPRVLQSGEMPREVYQELWRTITGGQEWRGELQNRRKDGTLVWELASISPVHDPLGRITHYLAIKEDITERKRTERERNEMEIQLRHAQKLESIGQLAAGIAHEINTPTQYIGDNARFLKDAFADVLRLFDQYAKLEESAGCNPACAAALAAVQEAARTADLGYLVQEIPKALDQSLEGVDRVSRIVRAMKDFSHPGKEEKTSVDLRRAIESTLTVSRSEWKYVAELVTEFDPDLPPVPCLPGEFNQVVLNLVVNAAHAIADVVGDDQQAKGTITVRTRRDGDWAEIRISDTGPGIPETVQHRLFEPFFTTKPVGRGTGQGLAIARSVVVDKHGGDIRFETVRGQGTTFVIRLPLAASSHSTDRRTA
jgi:PAS domain S-box-containing protein